MNIDDDYKILHVVFQTTHILKNDFKKFSNHLGLSEMEIKFLLSIGGGNNKISTLISFFNKHKSTITQKINSLEEKKYIVISSSEKDKRERIIALTAKGKHLYIKATAIKKEYIQKVFSTFTRKEKKQLLQLLEKLSQHTHHENIC